jgi:hypothetical protein
MNDGLRNTGSYMPSQTYLRNGLMSDWMEELNKSWWSGYGFGLATGAFLMLGILSILGLYIQ